MRRFQLHRDEDETGVSGTGIVAEGVQFTDGHVALRWLTDHTSTAIYGDLLDVSVIHGHGGKTRIVFLDEPGPDDPDPGHPNHRRVWVDGNLHDAVVIHREWARYTDAAARRAEAVTDEQLAERYAQGCAAL